MEHRPDGCAGQVHAPAGAPHEPGAGSGDAQTGPRPRPRSGPVRFWLWLTGGLSDLAESASAARAPLSVAVAFWLAMLVPDQTDEAVRVLLDPVAPQNVPLAVWLVLCGLLGAQMLLGGLYAFAPFEGQPMHGRARNKIDRFVFALIMASPCLAVGFAMALAHEADEEARAAAWRGALLATAGTLAVATAGDLPRRLSPRAAPGSPWAALLRGTRRRRAAQTAAGALALFSGLAAVAWSGAWWACAFVAWGAGAGAAWSRVRLRKQPRPQRGVVWCAVFLALAVYGFAGFFFAPVAPLELTIWFALLLPIMVLSALLREYARFRLLAFAVAAAVVFSFFDLNDVHTVRHRRPPAEAASVPTAKEAFGAWLDTREAWEVGAEGRPRPVFLVAAEGGGMRAAYWTALVLEELRARNPRFAERTFLIAGVSGGSVGAAAYAAALKRGLRPAERPAGAPPARGGGGATVPAAPEPPLASRARSVEALRADLLSPLLRGLFLELPTRALPASATTTAFGDVDRSRRIEGAFEASWLRATGTGIDDLHVQDLRPGPDAREAPHLLFLATSVETGHRMAVGHLAMSAGAPPGAALPGAPPCRVPGRGEEAATAARLWNLAEEAPGINLPLATAAMLSARFTLLTPAGTLPCGPGPRRRFVDGGYFENSGVTTLLDVVAEVRDIAADRGVRLVVVRIENSRATTNPAFRKDRPPEPPYDGFGELWSPVRAMMETRRARGELAVASLGRAVERSREECLRKPAAAGEGREAGPCLPIEQVVLELGPGEVHIPLGWWLSDGVRKDMERQLLSPEKPANAAALDCVRVLLAGGACERRRPAGNPRP